MRVSVQCFGHYADVFGSDEKDFRLESGATVAELVKQLEAQYSSMSNLAVRCRFSVNESYTKLETLLQDGDIVAVIPPMSGG